MSKKKDMNIIEATRLIALWNVTRASDKQDPEYIYRVMARWYSEKFGYKLDEVDDIPIETVAMHYYEAHYEDMTPEERNEEIKRLTQSDEEKIAADKADDDFLKQAIKEAEDASKLRAAASALARATEELQQVAIPKKVEGLKKELAQPDINMTFISEEEMERMGEWDILGPTPSSGK